MGTLICSHPPVIQQDVQPRWLSRELSWSVSHNCPAVIHLLFVAAWTMWTKTCGINLRYEKSFAAADIAVGWVDIGPTLLATSEIPAPANVRRLSVHLNNRMPWMF